jgi:hypothetical protein
MRYQVTSDGTPIGTIEIEPLIGLAHAELYALPAYAAVRYFALDAGQRFRHVGIWNATKGDFAEEFARAWAGGRLAVCDLKGAELGVASVVIIDWEGTPKDFRPRVVIDARPDMARIEAFLRTVGRGGDGRSPRAA